MRKHCRHTFWALAVLASCGWGSSVLAAGDDATVAAIGKTAISAQELAARTSARLKEQDDNYELQIHQLRFAHDNDRQAYIEGELNSLIDERVLSLEAAAKKTTGAALLQALKTPQVSDASMHQLYDSHKEQINQPYDAVAPQLKEYLEKQGTEEAQRRYFDSLRTKYHALAMLEPARLQVAAVGPQRGPVNARVTIVEFSDFQCPYCGKFEPNLRNVLEKYPTQVKVVYRHLPLSSLHPFAQKAAEAAVCAQNQGKFWEMHDLLFAEQSQLSVDALKEKG